MENCEQTIMVNGDHTMITRLDWDTHYLGFSTLDLTPSKNKPLLWTQPKRIKPLGTDIGVFDASLNITSRVAGSMAQNPRK